MKEEYIWVEKYRPKTVEETILPDELKKTFQAFVDNGDLPNLLLTGSGGVGKTTIAKAILEELDCDYIMINGSEEGRQIDVLRNKIRNFASSMSFKKKRKFVIIDEADYMNPESVQPALRNFMESFSKNCGFILTCNFPSKITDLIHSRCTVIDFKFKKQDKPKLAAQFFKRCINILDTEGIEYDKKAVVQVIQKYFPDNRRVLNELQRYSAVGKIDSGILVKLSDANTEKLIDYLKHKQFNEMRKWVAQNIDTDAAQMIRTIYDIMDDHIKSESRPEAVVIIADYQFKAAFVADQEINLVAMYTELMANCQWNQ